MAVVGLFVAVIALTRRPAAPNSSPPDEQLVGALKEAFNHWRAVPRDAELRRLAAQGDRARNLAKAAELAKGDRQREAISHLEACLGPGATHADRAVVHVLIGNAYMDINDSDEAEGHYREAETAAREAGDSAGLAAALGNMGSISLDQGDLDKALQCFQEALSIDRGISNRIGQAHQLGNIGLVYREQGQLDQALENHQRALEIQGDLGDRLGQANQLGDIGLVYREQGELDQALEHFRKALYIDSEIGFPLGQANALGNMGSVYLLKGQLDQALEHMEQALKIFERVEAPLEMETTEKTILSIRATLKQNGQEPENGQTGTGG